LSRGPCSKDRDRLLTGPARPGQAKLVETPTTGRKSVRRPPKPAASEGRRRAGAQHNIQREKWDGGKVLWASRTTGTMAPTADLTIEKKKKRKKKDHKTRKEKGPSTGKIQKRNRPGRAGGTADNYAPLASPPPCIGRPSPTPVHAEMPPDPPFPKKGEDGVGAKTDEGNLARREQQDNPDGSVP